MWKAPQQRPDLRWLIPSFWLECVTPRKVEHRWPLALRLHHVPGLVHKLAEKGLWLEQEPLVVDAQIVAALQEVLRDDLHMRRALLKRDNPIQDIHKTKRTQIRRSCVRL